MTLRTDLKAWTLTGFLGYLLIGCGSQPKLAQTAPSVVGKSCAAAWFELQTDAISGSVVELMLKEEGENKWYPAGQFSRVKAPGLEELPKLVWQSDTVLAVRYRSATIRKFSNRFQLGEKHGWQTVLIRLVETDRP